MARWEGDAAGRLRQAAIELYAERGYEQTTVADIAQRAGLTSRTFFRHFADKRELLFANSAALEERMVAALPGDVPPMDAVAAALDAAAGLLGGDQTFARQRLEIIMAHSELHERELIKMSRLAAALAAGLRERGAGEPEADLAAHIATVVLQVGFGRWVAAPAGADLAAMLRDALTRLRDVATR